MAGRTQAALALLAGCASTKPYGYAYLIDPIDASTDYWVHPNRSWQCEPPWFRGGVGLEHKSGVRVGLTHYSTVRCGTFNEKPEIFYNGIEVGGDWGGWK